MGFHGKRSTLFTTQQHLHHSQHFLLFLFYFQGQNENHFSNKSPECSSPSPFFSKKKSDHNWVPKPIPSVCTTIQCHQNSRNSILWVWGRSWRSLQGKEHWTLGTLPYTQPWQPQWIYYLACAGDLCWVPRLGRGIASRSSLSTCDLHPHLGPISPTGTPSLCPVLAPSLLPPTLECLPTSLLTASRTCCYSHRCGGPAPSHLPAAIKCLMASICNRCWQGSTWIKAPVLDQTLSPSIRNNMTT